MHFNLIIIITIFVVVVVVVVVILVIIPNHLFQIFILFYLATVITHYYYYSILCYNYNNYYYYYYYASQFEPVITGTNGTNPLKTNKNKLLALQFNSSKLFMPYLHKILFACIQEGCFRFKRAHTKGVLLKGLFAYIYKFHCLILFWPFVKEFYKVHDVLLYIWGPGDNSALLADVDRQETLLIHKDLNTLGIFRFVS